VRAGKVGAIGVSNVNGEQLEEALATSERQGLASFGWVQNEYSLLRREAEREVLPLCAREGLGFTPFSPLCGGWLTGKYDRARPVCGALRVSELLVLAHEDVKRLLPMEECIELMAEALADLARGLSWQPLRFVVRPPEDQSLMGLMPAHRSSPEPAYGLKAVCIFPGNPARGLDAHQGGVLLFDGETGELRALIDGSAVTSIRTAAVSAVATRALAR